MPQAESGTAPRPARSTGAARDLRTPALQSPNLLAADIDHLLEAQSVVARLFERGHEIECVRRHQRETGLAGASIAAAGFRPPAGGARTQPPRVCEARTRAPHPGIASANAGHHKAHVGFARYAPRQRPPRNPEQPVLRPLRGSGEAEDKAVRGEGDKFFSVWTLARIEQSEMRGKPTPQYDCPGFRCAQSGLRAPEWLRAILSTRSSPRRRGPRLLRAGFPLSRE